MNDSQNPKNASPPKYLDLEVPEAHCDLRMEREAAESLEAHLAECKSCRVRLEARAWRELKPSRPAQSTSLGSSSMAILLGPFTVGFKRLKRARAQLAQLGVHLSSLDADAIWGWLDVRTPPSGPARGKPSSARGPTPRSTRGADGHVWIWSEKDTSSSRAERAIERDRTTNRVPGSPLIDASSGPDTDMPSGPDSEGPSSKLERFEQTSQHLPDWMDRIRDVVEGDGDDLGIYLLEAPGEPVVDDRLEAQWQALAETIITAGEIRVSNVVAEMLRPRNVLLVPVPDTDTFRLPRGPIVRWRLEAPEGSPPVVALTAGSAELIHDVRMTVSGARVQRCLESQVGGPPASSLQPLVQGDKLRVMFEAPAPAWTYLLMQKDGNLGLPHGGAPVRRPTQSRVGRTDIVLDDQPGEERPLLLLTSDPLDDLAALVAQVNALGETTKDLRRNALVDKIAALKRLRAVALIDAGTFEHISRPQLDVSPELKEAQQAILEDRYPELEAIARHQLDQDLEPHVRATYLHLLGLALRRMGNVEDALDCLMEAIQRALEAGDRSLQAKAVRETGKAYTQLGRFDEALRSLEQAIELHLQDDDSVEFARDQVARAWVLACLDRLGEAVEAYRLAEEPARQGGELLVEAGALEGLGQVYHELGRLEPARGNLERAHALFRRRGDQRGKMRTHGDIGLLALENGDVNIALGHFSHQLELARTFGNAALRGQTLAAIGQAYKQLGLAEKAREHILAALELLPADPPRYRGEPYTLLAEMALEAGDLEEAGEWLARAAKHRDALSWYGRWRVALIRGRWKDRHPGQASEAEAEYERGVDAVESVRRSLPGGLRSHFLTLSLSLYEGWIEHLQQRGAAPEILLDAVERARARAFLDALAQSERNAAEVVDVPATLIEDLSHELVPVKQICAKLPPGLVLVEACCLPEKLLWFRIRREGVDMHPVRLDRERLESLAAAAIRACQRRPAATRDPTPDLSALEKLSDAVLKPILDWIAGEGEEPRAPLGLLPHGPLHGIPFHALPLPGLAEEGRTCPLGARRGVFYAPSLQAVLRWLERSGSRARGMLALADPHGDLPFAAEEARAAVSVVGEGRLLERENATDAALRTHAPEARYIHLAAHAEWGGPGKRAVIHLASEDDGCGADIPRSAEHQAGTFAGFKAEQKLGKGDVDAASIAGLVLDAELVVASACEAGAGELSRTGEGPNLLSWAFLASGARSVIAASWRLDDEVAAELMKRFYRYLAHGATKADALARAQQDVAACPGEVAGEAPGTDQTSSSADDHHRSHPYYWAGFFLTGDWR